jgi:hypothetical protein
MKKAITMYMALILLAVLPSTVMAMGILEGLGGSSSKSDPKMQEAPDPRIGRLSRPPTPRASGSTHTNSVGMQFTLVQPGTFKMGGADPALAGKGLEYEAKIVEYETSITRPYYIGITTVTERQWAAVMGTPATDIYHYFNRDNKDGYAPGARSGPDAPAMRQITIDARLNPQYVDSAFSPVYTGQWRAPPVLVKINGGSEQLVLAQGISPIKRTFSAPIGAEVEVLWRGEDGTGQLHVYYTDTPAGSITDTANVLGALSGLNSGVGRVQTPKSNDSLSGYNVVADILVR